MKFIVIGAGDVGLSLAQKLALKKYDVILIDNDEHVLDNIPAALDLQTLHGNGCDPEILVHPYLETRNSSQKAWLGTTDFEYLYTSPNSQFAIRTLQSAFPVTNSSPPSSSDISHQNGSPPL